MSYQTRVDDVHEPPRGVHNYPLKDRLKLFGATVTPSLFGNLGDHEDVSTKEKRSEYEETEEEDVKKMEVRESSVRERE